MTSDARFQNCYLHSRDGDGTSPLVWGDESGVHVDFVGYAIIPLEACHEAAARITTLEAELAEARGEVGLIVEWLNRQKLTLGGIEVPAGPTFATAIASGAYKGQTDD